MNLDHEEHFRWCVYCKADCQEDEPGHAWDCPTNTRLFPVREEDVLCPGCKKTHIGMRCCGCGDEFKVGDVYTHRKTDDGPPPTYQIVCMSCAALDAEIETV